MKWVKSKNKVQRESDDDAWKAEIDYLPERGEGISWYSRISLYADTKKEAKQLRKIILKTLNKAEEKQNDFD